VEENELQRARGLSEAGKRKVNRNHKFLSRVEKLSKLHTSAHPNDVDRGCKKPPPPTQKSMEDVHSCPASSVQKTVGPEPSLGVSRQNINRRKIKHWMDNQHLTRWQGLSSTMRQAQELILGLCLTAKARLSFNKTQSMVITALLTGHNILRRHLHAMELTVPCVGGMEQRMKPQSTFSECEAVAALRHAYLGH